MCNPDQNFLMAFLIKNITSIKLCQLKLLFSLKKRYVINTELHIRHFFPVFIVLCYSMHKYIYHSTCGLVVGLHVILRKIDLCNKQEYKKIM